MFTTIGHVLRMKRLVRNLTQQEVAEKIGVSVSMVSAWENDRFLFSKLIKAEAISCSLQFYS